MRRSLKEVRREVGRTEREEVEYVGFVTVFIYYFLFLLLCVMGFSFLHLASLRFL